MRRLDLRGSTADPRTVLPRADVDVESVTAQIKPILADVAARGDEAVLDWGARFDGVRSAHVRVPREVINACRRIVASRLDTEVVLPAVDLEAHAGRVVDVRAGEEAFPRLASARGPASRKRKAGLDDTSGLATAGDNYRSAAVNA